MLKRLLTAFLESDRTLSIESEMKTEERHNMIDDRHQITLEKLMSEFYSLFINCPISAEENQGFAGEQSPNSSGTQSSETSTSSSSPRSSTHTSSRKRSYNEKDRHSDEDENHDNNRN